MTQSRRTSPASIRVSGLSHQYRAQHGTIPALESIDLEIADGDFVALLGPSGCGKSTLLRCMSGLLAPSAGRVELGGRDPRHGSAPVALGWLAQADGLLPWYSVARNVGLPLALGGRGPADQSRVSEAIRQVGLAGSEQRYPHELSGGMRQRAALARALVGQPDYLFLDEPFANLDELRRERLGDLLLRVRDPRRPTTLLVTHSVTEAVRLADRVLVFSPSPGRIVRDQRLPGPAPRAYDQPDFGALVENLKATLLAGEAPDEAADPC